MRAALASLAFLILAASAAPAASQSDPAAMQSSTSSSTTTSTSTSTVSGTPVSKAKARDQIRAAGYRNVHALLKGPDGVWHAKATKDGQPRDVSLDLMGNVTSS